MPPDALALKYRQAIEAELQRVVNFSNSPHLADYHQMLVYHMGWEGEGAGPGATGKRIRPLLLLLTVTAAGGDWRAALPAAAAVELVHNFSLIHDDIQDDSPMRRGRPTVWKLWGIPQAINAGDAMFTLAQLALLDLAGRAEVAVVLQAAKILNGTCALLTQGQYLDMAYERRGDLNIEAYWQMVQGKTAALFSACTQIGAWLACSSPECREAYRNFGADLGLAFQVVDDYLGVWGDTALTGKSSESDILARKKSLPILFGLSQKGRFYQAWTEGQIMPADVPRLTHLLESEGAREFTQEHAARLTHRAMGALGAARPQGEAGDALRHLAEEMLSRTG
ncbi:MAG: polyprenyl synthetase family protein [Anaerolineales bacterium]|nr:polyprenyl synthetase family protein [Anaerolineales bacterium]